MSICVAYAYVCVFVIYVCIFAFGWCVYEFVINLCGVYSLWYAFALCVYVVCACVWYIWCVHDVHMYIFVWHAVCVLVCSSVCACGMCMCVAMCCVFGVYVCFHIACVCLGVSYWCVSVNVCNMLVCGVHMSCIWRVCVCWHVHIVAVYIYVWGTGRDRVYVV